MSPFDRRRWGTRRGEDDAPGTPPRALVVALVLACASLMLLDQGDPGEGRTLDPVRDVVGEVVGPVQTVAASAARPFVELPDWFEDRDGVQAELATLQDENAELREQVRTTDFDRQRLEQFEGLTSAAVDLGQALVPARVIGFGSAQSFATTVTIDAGSSSGIRPDLTVVNADGLVGRVLRVTDRTATVLLVTDPDSVVGARLARTMDLGFVRGRGIVGDRGRLDLELVDRSVVPGRDDVVVTWGSRGRGTSPYVAGVPVGRVVEVYASPLETAQRAVIEPYVDFAALDVVGVVVPSGSRSDRAVVEADGSLR